MSPDNMLPAWRSPNPTVRDRCAWLALARRDARFALPAGGKLAFGVIAFGSLLMVAGVAIVLGATRARRRRWRALEPFVGDELGAPEPVFVPQAVVYTAYLGWVMMAAGGTVLAVALT
jgi:hypothetical protein